MSYIDKSFYDDIFCGTPIEDNDLFRRLSDISSDVIYGVCNLKPSSSDVSDETFKKAVAYEVEMLYKQGGIDAVLGYAESSLTGGSESLGDYSCSGFSPVHGAVLTFNGIPVSSMALMMLSRMGLMCRWAYARRE